MYRLNVSGLASSPPTSMLLGAAIGTAIGYVGQKTSQQGPHPELPYHPVQKQHGVAEAAVAVAVVGVAFRYLRDVL